MRGVASLPYRSRNRWTAPRSTQLSDSLPPLVKYTSSVRSAPQQLGYASAGGSKRLGRLTRHAVNTARVAERVRQKRHHGLERRG